jgi:hypothetical protein
LVHQRRDPAAVCDQHRRPARHSLGRGVPKVLVLRGQNENIRVAIGRPLGVIVEWTGKEHSPVQAQLCRKGFQPPAIAVAFVRAGHDQQRGLSRARSPACERFQHQLRALLGDKTSEEENKFRPLRDVPLAAKRSRRGKMLGQLDTVATHNHFRVGDATFDQLPAFLFGRCDQARRAAQHLLSKHGMIDSLEPQVAHDRLEHPHRLDHIRQPAPATMGGHGRPQ